MTTIRTPRGKRLTPARYVALVAMLNSRDRAKDCEHGHDGCAAWASGPCENEVAATNGLIKEEKETT